MRSVLFACVAVLTLVGEAALAQAPAASATPDQAPIQTQTEPQIDLLDPPPPRPTRGGRNRPPPEARPSLDREQLFIAPSGEPFRAAAGAPYPVAAWFVRADANHDGQLTIQEFVDDSLVLFKQLDVNNDGVVDGFEGAAYEQTIVPELGAQRDDFGGMRATSQPGRSIFNLGRRPKRTQPAEGAALYGLLNEPQPVNGADSDLDRRITLSEAVSAAQRRFRRLDTDNDGVLRLATLPKTPAQAQAMKTEEARR